jgi:two-component system sensor histidine kinase KdpD
MPRQMLAGAPVLASDRDDVVRLADLLEQPQHAGRAGARHIEDARHLTPPVGWRLGLGSRAAGCGHVIAARSRSAERLARRAWRSAQRLGSDLDLLWVKRPGTSLTPEQDTTLTALKQLCSMVGATLLVEESDDIPGTTARVATERGTTYILMGRSRQARGLSRLRIPLPQQLMSRLPGVDVWIVADRALRHEPPP